MSCRTLKVMSLTRTQSGVQLISCTYFDSIYYSSQYSGHSIFDYGPCAIKKTPFLIALSPYLSIYHQKNPLSTRFHDFIFVTHRRLFPKPWFPLQCGLFLELIFRWSSSPNMPKDPMARGIGWHSFEPMLYSKHLELYYHNSRISPRHSIH